MDDKVAIAALLAPKVYDDLASPTLKAMGKTGEKIYKALSAGIDYWADQKIKRFQDLQNDIAKKLSEVPIDEISDAPPSYILIPAMMAWSYSMDNKKLRNMYANLLSRAILKENQNDVHPAFTDIIRNLHPDESIILASLYYSKNAAMIDTIWLSKESQGEFSKGKEHLILMPEQKAIKISAAGLSGEIEHKVYVKTSRIAPPHYVDNLARLGLISLSTNNRELANTPNDYETILNSSLLIEDMKLCEEKGFIFSPKKSMISITPLGLHFGDICIMDPLQTISKSI